MNEKMNGGISTLRGIFCRLSFQKGGITAETIAAQGFDGGIFSVDTRQKGMTFLRHAFFLCLFLHAGVLSGPACRGSDCGRFSLFFIGLFYGFVNNFVSF